MSDNITQRLEWDQSFREGYIAGKNKYHHKISKATRHGFWWGVGFMFLCFIIERQF